MIKDPIDGGGGEGEINRGHFFKWVSVTFMKSFLTIAVCFLRPGTAIVIHSISTLSDLQTC